MHPFGQCLQLAALGHIDTLAEPEASRPLYKAVPETCRSRSLIQISRACVQGYKPDYMYLLQRTMMDSPDAAANLAKMIAKQPGPPIELNVIADLFLQRNMVREATAFLLEVLQDNNPEHEKLQTKASPSHTSPTNIPLFSLEFALHHELVMPCEQAALADD